MMAFIYCIENTINNKRYVGVTTYSIQHRWGEHQRMAQNYDGNRPLYRAMRKYGVESFVCYLLEECSDDIRWEKEQEWVKKLDTFYSGYNATQGGDGGSIIEIDKETFLELKNQNWSPQEMAEFFNCCTDTISAYAKKFGVHFRGWTQRYAVTAYFQNMTKEFYSVQDAARWVLKQGLSSAKLESIAINIGRCCKGERRSAYGIKWVKTN